MTEEKEGPVIATLYLEEPVSETGSFAAADALGSETVEAAADGLERFEYQLREGMTLRIGRAKTNDVPLKNRNVSRFHAVFSASASGVVLSDLSSLNGTFVNGSRITTPVDLTSGDVITIGDSKITCKLTLGEDESDDSVHGRTQTAQLAAVVVTVLVVDVCGYTKLSETLPPKDVAEMMNVWFQEVSEIVRKHGGEVDKYIGDCVMALWRGTHANATELARQAVRAGMEMTQKTKEMSESEIWMHRHEHPWSCRIALNTGEALMGTVGGAGRRDFTVLGDTVNVAFRLESVAKQKGTDFIVSKATAERVMEEFPARALGEVQVAGRTGTIEVYSLL
ncbi:MAG: adenylate/guanylate cyclase domain-containing protein [Bdellovibrionales bacterium]|nr:adenylate/guanylate cyclase domain-containing protein [Bdellovibrionales bacterium]